MATLFPATATRQPFAPINGSRLQNLTSLKNRQNALPSSLASPSKRKAVVYEEDAENIDPIIFASPKRSKGQDGPETVKPSTSHFVLTKAAPTFKDFVAACSPVKSNISRPALQPRSPAPKSNTSASSIALSAPAGRSPTRKRIGLLNKRRTASSSFTRVDPPKFSVGPVVEAPFSIAAALSGTIPSYGTRRASTSKPSSSIPRSVLEPGCKSGWFFEIHQDTAEEVMTNLMEHSTCILDISSDEETEARRRDERGKENVPPLDDISQTQGRLPISSPTSYDNIAESKARTRSLRRRKEIEDGAIDIDRSPLGDLEAEEFYGEGCTSSDVILVADDEAEGESDEPQPQPVEFVETDPQEQPVFEKILTATIDQQDMDAVPVVTPSCNFDFTIPVEDWRVDLKAIDELMTKSDAELPSQAKLFEPLEKAEEGFEVWESGSAKGEDELVS